MARKGRDQGEKHPRQENCKKKKARNIGSKARNETQVILWHARAW